MKKLKQTFVVARNVFPGRGFLPEIRKMRCPGIGKIVLTTNCGSWEAKESSDFAWNEELWVLDDCKVVLTINCRSCETPRDRADQFYDFLPRKLIFKTISWKMLGDVFWHAVTTSFPFENAWRQLLLGERWRNWARERPRIWWSPWKKQVAGDWGFGLDERWSVLST